MRDCRRPEGIDGPAATAEDTFILVDQETFRSKISAGRRGIPFLERQGQYWGLPPDDATAIHEFKRLRGTGVAAIIFAWPTFWWFDYYREFSAHLRYGYHCILGNERLVAFELRRRLDSSLSQ